MDEGGRWRRLVRGNLLFSLVAGFVLLLVAGSVLSIDARLSWLGSYARAQGAGTELAYLVFFAAVVGHLRTWSQWRRIARVVVVAGTMVALYAIFQALGLDPVETVKSTRRVYSTLGNAIFLGAYLLMTFFVTACEWFLEVVDGTGRGLSTARTPGPRFLGVSALSLALLCQLVALVLSQSRGPFLGLVAGCYVVLLFGLMAFRERSASRPAGSRATGWVRWRMPAILGLALLAMVLLIVSNTSGPVLSRLGEVPYLGRLSSVLDPGSRTIQVRLLIWQGVAELLSSDEAIAEPGGAVDPHHRGRRLAGFGPETFGLAINRHIPPQLGQLESRSKTPDRAHNDTLDRLVMTGVLGALLWLAIYATLFSLALRVLGLVESRRDAVALWAVLATGAAVGVAAPWMVSGRSTLSGVGLAVGLVASLAVFLTARVLVKGVRPPPSWLDWRVQAVALALMATFVAHVVEIHVGIAVTSTRLYFWCMAAVLLIVGRGWFETDVTNPGKRRNPKKMQAANQGPALWLISPMLTVGLCLPWVFTLTLGGADARRIGSILSRSWWTSVTAGGAGHPSALFWLVAGTIALGAIFDGPAAGEAERSRRRSPALRTSIILSTVAAAAVIQAFLVARSFPGGAGRPDVVVAALRAAGMYGLLTWGVLSLALFIGGILGWSSPASGGWCRRSPVAVTVIGLLVAGVGIAVIRRCDIDPIRADGALKAATSLTARSGFQEALTLLDHACRLAPLEPMYPLMRGRTALSAAEATTEDSERNRLFELAGSSLELARDLAPLDPDHHANLGRYAVRRALSQVRPERRGRLLERAVASYEDALVLRPTSVVLLNEYGRLLINMGRRDRARRALEKAIALDPLFPDTASALAALDRIEGAGSPSR